ncbi:hypothetical protein IT400_02060 [Candidatus Nomurabacteria bacterium]|nr:hypothetical protein [Candidatus Nomurabacteria bacterium]
MIYVNKTKISESDFVILLEKTKEIIYHDFKKKGVPKEINGVNFEGVVFNTMIEASLGTDFEGYIEQTGLHAFPDIIARKFFGLEVKMTIGDKWVSTGNSVLETTRIEDVQTIYMFFGKFGSGFEVKYRKYQECLYEVGVTHSPRYKIDMDLPSGKSIFDKIGIEYNIFRNDENSIKRLKDYYRKQLKDGEELWWIDSTSEEKSVSPVIKSLKLLDEKTKENFINEVYVLFPEIFGNSSVKFERAAAYLITGYNAVSSNLRDSFTAGGKVDLKINSKTLKVPQIFKRFSMRATEIKMLLNSIPREKLAYYWGIEVSSDPIMQWKTKAIEYTQKANPDLHHSDIELIFEM